jgi:hypothetical protein
MPQVQQWRWLIHLVPGLRTSPRFGRKSGVGVITCVGTLVGVAVAGNQSTVAVGVGEMVGVGESSRSGEGVSTGMHAAKLIMNNIIPLRIMSTFTRE